MYKHKDSSFCLGEEKSVIYESIPYREKEGPKVKRYT